MPGVRIFPFKEVESGSQVYENLIFEARSAAAVRPGRSLRPRQRGPHPDTALKVAAASALRSNETRAWLRSRESAPACR